MTTCGIIAEYNPFHNGHMRHIEEARRITGASHVVVVMSGNFVQRGEPAICNKFARTKMALLNGVDIVIELPVFFATASAEYFSQAAVKLLDDLNVNFLCFGSESGELQPLQRAADVLTNEPDSFKQALKSGLDAGLSFPKARGNALAESAVFEPNDILGVEYLKALQSLNSKIKPFTIKRDGAHYHSLNLNGTTASATAIRNLLSERRGRRPLQPPTPYVGANFITQFNDVALPFIRPLSWAELTQVMPPSAVEILQEEHTAGRLNFANNFSGIFHYALATMTPEQLTEIADVSEGLENRILSAALPGGTVSDVAAAVKTKRYALTRIYRALCHTILNIRQSELDFYAATGFSRYARVLGFKKTSAGLLGNLCDNAKIPVITNIKKAYDTLDRSSQAMLDKELQSTNIYYAPLKPNATVTQELSTPLIIV